MALRLLEVVVPDPYREVVYEVLGAQAGQPLGVWSSQVSEGQTLTRALLAAEEVEAVMDGLRQRLSPLPEFRMIVIPVEATVPRPPESEEPPPAEASPAAPPARDRISREELYADVTDALHLSGTFLALVALSAIVAAVGLVRNEVAVIIGAMVIAPLLGPNVALALAATLGDGDLARRVLKISGVGVLSALVLAAVLGVLLHVSPDLPQIASRTRVGLSDVVLALASGGAGVLSVTTGIPTALVGVMVAVALLPPLVTAGLLLGAAHWRAALGAVELLIANVICVNLAGVTTFLAQGVRPGTWWEANRARRTTRNAMALWIALLAALVAVLLVQRP